MQIIARIALAILGALIIYSNVAHAADIDIDARDRRDAFVPPASNPFAGFYVGIAAGVQFTDIVITDTFTSGDNLDGLSATGGLIAPRAGFNFCFERFCVGPYIEYGISDVSFDVVGEPLIVQDNYLQFGGQFGVLAGKSTMISVHLGRELENWTVGNRQLGISEIDVEASGWVVGGSVSTLIAPQTSFDFALDYVMLDDIEARGTDLTRNLEDSNSLRVKLGFTFRPAVTLPGLK